MPITWPAALASAPPESPSAIGALVCSMLCRVSVFWVLPESLAVMVRPFAVIVPPVTVGAPAAGVADGHDSGAQADLGRVTDLDRLQPRGALQLDQGHIVGGVHADHRGLVLLPATTVSR